MEDGGKTMLCVKNQNYSYLYFEKKPKPLSERPYAARFSNLIYCYIHNIQTLLITASLRKGCKIPF